MIKQHHTTLNQDKSVYEFSPFELDSILFKKDAEGNPIQKIESLLNYKYSQFFKIRVKNLRTK